MNIAFFLTPKNEIIYLSPESTMRQALEKMEFHRYTAVPLLDKEGRYVGTITEGDLLWKLKTSESFDFKYTEKIFLKDISLRMKNKPVRINAEIKDVISLAIEQNFVPVVDDSDIFIGIVRRREILEHYASMLEDKILAYEQD